MADNNNEAKQLQDRVTRAPHSQNWGLIIGVGIVVLVVLVMVINLATFQGRANPPDPAVTNPFWVQVIRFAGLGVSFSLGGWLLWRLLGRRRTPDQTYRDTYLQPAIRYTQQIEVLLKASANGHEQQLLTQIHVWWQTIEALTQALAELGRNDHIIQSDLGQLPGVVADLEQQLARETNPLLQADLEQMLAQRQNQRLSLEQLQITRRRAEIQIERTIAVLGTIYSQLLTYRSTFHVADYQQLADNVAEEVHHLQDYLEALQEVKGNRRLL